MIIVCCFVVLKQGKARAHPANPLPSTRTSRLFDGRFPPPNGRPGGGGGARGKSNKTAPEPEVDQTAHPAIRLQGTG